MSNHLIILLEQKYKTPSNFDATFKLFKGRCNGKGDDCRFLGFEKSPAFH